MQNRNNRQERGKLRKKSWLRLVPIPFTVFLTAMFYLQGQGVSRRLSGVFSPRQHTDEHLHVGCDVACLSRLGKWRRPYPADLRRLVSRHAHVDSPASDDRLRGAHPPPGDRKLRRKAAKPRVSATAIPFKDLSLRRQIAYIAAGLAGYVLAIPGSILVIALLVACSLIVLVEPFGVIGKRDAQDYCQEVPLAALPTIPHLPGFDPNQGVIHQLWCNTDTCAVLQAGAASAVPKSAIARTISPPLSQRLPGKPDTRIPPCARRSPRLRTTSRKTEASSPRRPDRAAMHAVRFLAAIALSASHLSGDAGILRELTRKVEPRHGPERKQERPDPVS